MSMRSQSHKYEAAESMHQMNRLPISINDNDAYKDRFRTKDEIVLLIGKKRKTEWEVWLGNVDEDTEITWGKHKMKNQLWEYPKDRPVMMNEKDIIALPLGRIALQMAKIAEIDAEAMRRERERVNSSTKKRKKEKVDIVEVSSDKDTEESMSPKKKKGRKTVVEKVVENTPKRRGRPPKNRQVEMPPNRKESQTSTRKAKEEKKSNKKTPIKKKKIIEESDEEEEDIEVIESIDNRKRATVSPKKTPISRKKKKTLSSSIESEEEKEPEPKRKKLGRPSKKDKEKEMSERKNKKMESSSDKSDEEDERMVETPKRRVIPTKKSYTISANSAKKKHSDIDNLFEYSESETDESDKRKEGNEKKNQKTKNEDNKHNGKSVEKPSSSSAHKGPSKSAHELYLEKEKKRRERKRGTKKKRSTRDEKIDMLKKHLLMGDFDDDVRSNGGSDREDSPMGDEGNGEEEEITYYTSRPRSRSRSPSDVPSVRGSPVHFMNVSRASSPTLSRNGSLHSSRDGSRAVSRSVSRSVSRCVSREASPEIELTEDEILAAQREADKAERLSRIKKMKEEDEKKKRDEHMKKEMEAEKKRNEKNTSETLILPPANQEKVRAKARVAMRAGRNPGIIDDAPTLNPTRINSTVGKGIGGNKNGRLSSSLMGGNKSRISTLSTSHNPLDSIMMEIDGLSLPSASSVHSAPPISRPFDAARPNYINPTGESRYAPDMNIEIDDSPRIEYGGANDIEEPQPITMNDPDDPVDPMHRQRRRISPDDLIIPPLQSTSSSTPIPPIPIPSIPFESMDSIQPMDPSISSSCNTFPPSQSIPSTSQPSHSSFAIEEHGERREVSPFNDEMDDGMRDDLYDFAPASPDSMDAPVSPVYSINNRHDELTEYDVDEEEIMVLTRQFKRKETLLPAMEIEADKISDKKSHEILEEINEYLEDGRAERIIWALDWIYHREKNNHFDTPSNRQFIFELITSNQTPSPTLLSALSLVVRWDVNNCDRKRRIDHSYINEFYHHPQASLSFVVLPSFIENNNGVISMRKTPLSEAVRVHSFLWSEFLVKMGANVNDRVIDQRKSINSYIITEAVERGIQGVEDQFSLIRLLLSYGANRERALSSLESMKKMTIASVQGVDEGNFDMKYPFYRDLHTLLKIACDTVALGFQSLLGKVKELSEVGLKVDWVKETVCTTPYNNTLVIQFQDYFKREEINNSRSSSNSPSVFAVVVGTSKDDVMKRNELHDSYRNVQAGLMEFRHHSHRPHFVLYPCVKKNSFQPNVVKKLNEAALLPLRPDMNIFIIPSTLYPDLKSFTVEADKEYVPCNKIIFGGLVRLILKDGDGRNVEDVVKQLNGTEGFVYDQIKSEEFNN